MSASPRDGTADGGLEEEHCIGDSMGSMANILSLGVASEGPPGEKMGGQAKILSVGVASESSIPKSKDGGAWPISAQDNHEATDCQCSS